MEPGRVLAIRLAAAPVEIDLIYFLCLEQGAAVSCVDVAYVHVLCVGAPSLLTIGACIAIASRIHNSPIPIVEHRRLSINDLA